MAKLNPRRRRQRQQYLAKGPKNQPQQIFSEPDEYNGDLGLAIKVLRMAGYKINQEVLDLIVDVPKRIAKDEKQDPKISLRATNLLRMVVKDAKEIELMEAEIEAFKGGGQPEEVIIREDVEFFGNDAHNQSEDHATTQRENATDDSAEGPAA